MGQERENRGGREVESCMGPRFPHKCLSFPLSCLNFPPAQFPPSHPITPHLPSQFSHMHPGFPTPCTAPFWG